MFQYESSTESWYPTVSERVLNLRQRDSWIVCNHYAFCLGENIGSPGCCIKMVEETPMTPGCLVDTVCRPHELQGNQPTCVEAPASEILHRFGLHKSRGPHDFVLSPSPESGSSLALAKFPNNAQNPR